ncbi:MAG TPA: WhiB family transcriptional regulator, partial [Streptomyces sp.]|nr:WhiB family transcriptional regulator [Streptomyces sp.]
DPGRAQGGGVMGARAATLTIAGTKSPHREPRPLLGFDVAPDPGLKAALCRVIEPEVFFPERGDRRTAALAREICMQCPVRAVCLTDALESEDDASHSHRFGIRGGTSPEQRYKIYRRTAARAGTGGAPAGSGALELSGVGA